MSSTPRTSNGPLSPANQHVSAPRPAAVRLLALALLTLVAGPAAAPGQTCLPGCDPMNPDPLVCCPADVVGAPCDTFRAQQEDNRAAVTACVAESCLGRGLLAECTRALRCSRNCAKLATNYSRELRSNMQAAGGCVIGRGAARRACTRCEPEALPPVCSELAVDTTGSRCQQRCISSQPWIQECYRKCDDRCVKDRCAIAVCRQSCRDSICSILQNTCSPGGDRPRNTVQRDLRNAYDSCCGDAGCLADSSGDIVCESTTSTTSSTSSSSTRQTTTSTLRGTTTTTTLASSS
jgi:hypothetical protein